MLTKLRERLVDGPGDGRFLTKAERRLADKHWGIAKRCWSTSPVPASTAVEGSVVPTIVPKAIQPPDPWEFVQDQGRTEKGDQSSST